MVKNVLAVFLVVSVAGLIGCGGGSGSGSSDINNDDVVADEPDTPTAPDNGNDDDPVDVELRAILSNQDLVGDAAFNRRCRDDCHV